MFLASSGRSRLYRQENNLLSFSATRLSLGRPKTHRCKGVCVHRRASLVLVHEHLCRTLYLEGEAGRKKTNLDRHPARIEQEICLLATETGSRGSEER